MPIQSYAEKVRVGVIGKIRLGVRVKTDKGEYPKEVAHFVLDDAPGVEAVYGKEPKELDVFCVSDKLEDVIPHWYKWYGGGVRDGEGNIIGGRLYCYGDGKIAHHLAKRDPLTKVVPTRECLAEKCPDWAPGGKQQCRPSMSLFVMLPRVSLYGLYQIDTNSVTSIMNCLSSLGTIQKQWKLLRGIPFKLMRVPTNISYIDPKTTKERSQVHYPLQIQPNEEEWKRLHGKDMDSRVHELLSRAECLSSPRELLEESTQDVYASTAAVSSGATPPPVQALPPGIGHVAEDPELAPLFAELCALKKKNNTDKNRMLTARKFEKDADPKMALRAYLNHEITVAKAKVAPVIEHTPQAPVAAQPPPVEAPKGQPQPTPVPNADGLI